MSENYESNYHPRLPIIIYGKLLSLEKSEKFLEFKELQKTNHLEVMLSSYMGIPWCQDSILVKDFDSVSADYNLPNELSVDLGYGVWAASGAIHEMVHLILGQNSWNQNSQINNFINAHPNLLGNEDNGNRNGYFIEQIIAYLTQRDLLFELSKTEPKIDVDTLNRYFGETWLNGCVENEAPGNDAKIVANNIIARWQEREPGNSIIEWLANILPNLDN